MKDSIDENVCEHCYQSAPDCKRFCSDSCRQCELIDCDESKECAGVCLPKNMIKTDFDRGFESGLAQGKVDAYRKICELEREIERLKAARSQSARDIAYLDRAGSRLGTRMDSVGGIPSEIPGFEPDDGSGHLHFVMMPIGSDSRRAVVKWLKSQNALCKHNDNPRGCVKCNEPRSQK